MTSEHSSDFEGLGFAVETMFPAEDAVAINISSTDHTLTVPSRGLYVGTGGDVKVDMMGSGTVTFANIADGTVLPIRVTKVYKTGTDAADMISLY